MKIRSLKACSATLEVHINWEVVVMPYDPGAAKSVINKQVWTQIGAPSLKPAKSLVAYTNVVVETMGEAIVEVKAFGLVRKLKVTVVDDTIMN